jgi:hypothetical protein
MAEEAHALVIDQVWRTSSIHRGSAAFWGFGIYVNCSYLFFAQVVQKALDDANLSGSDLSAVAVTVGPGLSLCLRGMDVPLSFTGLLKCLFTKYHLLKETRLQYQWPNCRVQYNWLQGIYFPFTTVLILMFTWIHDPNFKWVEFDQTRTHCSVKIFHWLCFPLGLLMCLGCAILWGKC